MTTEHTPLSDLLPCGCVVTYSVVFGKNVTTITRCTGTCTVLEVRRRPVGGQS